ncbi:MAG: ATP-dependent zinc metalloprotease FtsH [Waddliaceae bacterium]
MAKKKQDFKKGFSGGFVWILLLTFFFALMVQNFLETKRANTSFSHQLEHLVNLQMILPEESRKTAVNDNLVTFSGKFREKTTELGKDRYKYLELLQKKHLLEREKESLETELKENKEKIEESTDLFLHLSGLSIPANGYIVIEDPLGDGNQSVIINELSQRRVTSLRDLSSRFPSIQSDPSTPNLTAFDQSLKDLIRNFRSTALGIGNESIKEELRKIQTEVNYASTTASSVPAQLDTYDRALQQLQEIVTKLNSGQSTSHLSQLRSVRDYKEALGEYRQIDHQIDENRIQLDRARNRVADTIWFFNNREISTRKLEQEDSEEFTQWFQSAKKEWDSFSTNQGGLFKAPDQPLNTVLKKTFKSEPPAPNYFSYIITFLPILLVLGALWFLFSRQMRGGMGGGAMNFGKSPAKLLTKEMNKVTFKDVAGIDEAQEELQEIVEFLRNPQKFTALGGHIPKGVLCVGPPGTGKTLIAKAVAGEADRPFFSISGSDFVEMFVGVGASRIRDMFEQAKKNSPCIVFIDEIDAVGRHRGAGIGGGHDEREQTLNQLLVEMDGFATNEGVIIIAATNRPDVLDKALLRPGRFDRRVMISLPDIKGRFEILKVHARKIKMDGTVDLMVLAQSTPGSSGADLENILNEAALIAARKNKSAVQMDDVSEARDKVMFGKERRSLEIDEDEKKTTAYHEAGHTIVGMVVEHADAVDKVTIIPRGFSLGSTMFLPKKNRLSYWKKELIDQLAVLMGGRCAEEVFVEDISSGARQDIVQATNIARSMVCQWGMSEKLGIVTYDDQSDPGDYSMGHHEKKYSDDTAKAIDEEVKEILTDAYERAKNIILERRDEVELMTDLLIKYETLNRQDIEKIVKKEWTKEDEANKLRELKEAKKHRDARSFRPPTPPKKTGEKPSTEPPNAYPGDIRV